MSTKESLQFWTIVLLGLFYISVRCDARAVNVSNTWTMPQEGLNVFYRFFRDRISWFEADAVCQFHHANLVTVDNSFQFDATRDLLRELDVNDIVWIGLMRPESSERFMWSNSRPLVTDTGYWAESLPLMDAPLCAVIDPIRDYRWHALRCGGPETASFLCEMPVPSWAETCILKDMPNLTMQYMADTASIELIRNCEEEGLLRQTCKGKQDRERALRELICPRERLEAQRINDITNSHFKSLQIINSIRTDNNENNDIELLPLGQNYGTNSEKIPEQSPTEKNTVQRLIEQFNVDELMQADEPLSGGGFKMFGEKPIPVKKDAVAAKRTIVIRNYPRKTQLQKQSYKKSSKKQTKQQLRELALDDMMMGDQPQHDGEPEMLEHVLDEEDDVSNEIMEALPHKKKILAQDLKTMATITERPVESEKKKVHESVEEKNIERSQQQVNESDMTTDATTTTVTEVGTTAAAAASSTSANITPTTTTTTTSTTTTTTTTAASSSSSSSPTATVPAIATTFPTTVVTSEELGFSYSPTITSSTYGVSSPSTTTITSSSTSLQDLPNRTNITFAHESQQQTTIVAPATATVPPATIGHPMHPQQPRSNIITEETQHPHVKESADNSHFIPPMLLVKSHYVPPAKHEHEHEHEHKHGHEQHGNRQDSDSSGDGEGIEQRLTAATTTTITVATSTETDAIKQPAEHEHHRQHQSTATVSASSTSTTMETVTRYANVADKTDFADVVIISTTVPAADVTTTTNSEVVTAKDTHASIIDVSSSNPTKGNADNTRKKTPTTILQPVNISDESLDETSTTTTTTTTMPVTTTAQISIEDSIAQTSTIQSMPNETATTTRPPEGSSVVALLLKENEKSINSMTSKVTNEQQLAVKHEAAAAAATTTTKAVLSAVAEVQAEVAAGIVDTLQISHGKEEVIIIATTDAPATTTSTTTTVTTTTAAPIKATTKHVYAHIHATRKPTKATHISTTTEEPATTHNFLNEETEPPFKPNRHRELTQPETVSYFKKILG